MNYWQGVKGQVDGFTYWYNLGTVQTLRGSFPDARFSFEKARHLTLYSDATERQLSQVNRELSVDTSTTQLGPLFANTLVALGPMKIWFVVLVLSMALMLMIRREWPKRWKWAMLSVALSPILLLSWFQLKSVAIVALKPIEVHEGPSKVFATGRALPAGARVLGWKKGDWIAVRDEGARTMWLPRSEVVLKSGWLWGNSP